MREQGARYEAVERLRRRSDFRAAASGTRAPGRNFVVQAHGRGDEGAVRVGFTVSRQVGNAVERNRVRRRLREIVSLSAAADAGRLRRGFDYVLIGRRAALGAQFSEMMHEFDAALSRLHTGGGKRGTGSARRDPLHEAGSPSRPQSRRGKPPQSPELPPHER